MRHFYLILNPMKDGVSQTAALIQEYLEERGCVCWIQGQAGNGEEPQSQDRASTKQPSDIEGEIYASYRYTDACRVPKDTECVITLGGDGTLIQAARDLAGRKIPMLGVNLGNLGYLTQVGRQEDVTGILDELIAGQYQLEKRMMLKGSVVRNGAVLKEDLALNEVVIARREMPRLLKLKIYVNGEELNQYQADGMIVATPTGSTAYNLSAGGPIVEPTARMTILTPICSHALNGRSIVLSSEDRIEIEVMGNDEDGQSAVFDGDTFIHLKVGDRLRIERSEVETVLVKLKTGSFLDNLRSKLAGI